MYKGYFCLVLHSHLPFVRHPEYEDFLEERWFYEAITEVYIPLILVIERLLNENLDFRLTLSFSPTLAFMLEDELLQTRYLNYIEKLIELSYKEMKRTSSQPEFHRLAVMYSKRFLKAKHTFLRHKKNLLNAFIEFSSSAKIELISSAATHGYFPLMDVCWPSIRAQVKVAINEFERIFKKRPFGFWLPECGYQPPQDKILKEENIKYFFVEAHGLLHARPRPKYGIFAPVYCQESGIACFARDISSSKAVWSSIEGYPGDYDYREFYRDIGFDLDYSYIREYISSDGTRINTGIKYYRITGPTEKKLVYIPERAEQKVIEHAEDFILKRKIQIEYLYEHLNKKPIIVSSYDTELFGHWWFEGPWWLEHLIRKLSSKQKTIKMVTPSEYLTENPKNQVVQPSMSSWGWKGYNEMWLQRANDWIYPHLHKASEKMSELVRLYPRAKGLLKEALNQALRELLLAQSSDWAFIMATGTHRDYAIKRTEEHLLRFLDLYKDIKNGSINEEYLKELRLKDNIFPQIDYTVHQ